MEAEESELVVAGDVIAEVMEREAPVESPAEEPRGWFSWLLGPRRESGAETNADASKPEPKPVSYTHLTLPTILLV